MKVLFLVLSLSVFAQFQAQTPLIAHKSHSGNLNSYFVDPNSNFGWVESMNKPFVKELYLYSTINDSLVLRQLNAGDLIIALDTLVNGQRESLESFELEDQRLLQIKKQKRSDSLINVEYKKYQNTKENNLVPIYSNPNKNDSNPSFLLILFSVSAIVMLLFRLMFGRRTPSII